MAGETTPWTENLRDVVHGTVSLNGRIETWYVVPISNPSIQYYTARATARLRKKTIYWSACKRQQIST